MRRRRTMKLRFLAAALALAAAPTVAHAQRFTAEYDGAAYGVIALGKAEISAAASDDRYDATGKLHTVGLAVLFGKAAADATATGRLAGGAAAPSVYTLLHDYHGGIRHLRVEWGGPKVAIASDPPRNYVGEIPTTDAQQREGRDPLSTLVTLGAHVAATGRCAGAFRVFDGFYVYDLTMSDAGPPGRYRRGDIDLPVVRCTMRQQRVAGYARRADLAKELPPASIWFAILPGMPVAVLTRFSTGLPLGEATISLTHLEVD